MHLALVAAALAGRPPDLPAEARAWVDRLEAAYAHYEDVSVTWVPQARAGLACPPGGALPLSVRSSADPDAQARYEADPAAFVAACEAGRHDAWELWADLDPVDRRVYNALRLRVSPVPDGRDAAGLLAEVVASGATATRGFHVVVPSGAFLVEGIAPCAVAGMFVYEAADLLDFVGEGAAAVAWSPCGAVHFEMRDAAWLREEAAGEREFWGLTFPAARRREKVELPQ